MSTERSAERAGGTVADAFGDLGNPDVGVTEQVLRERHAPCEEVFHRRQADSTRESLEKRRARKRDLLRELRHRPGTRGIAMHVPHRCGESRVGQPAQQPCWSTMRVSGYSAPSRPPR